MKIAQIAPLAESVPPALYGGTERVVSWLTEELVRRGHNVTLFASGDSNTAAELVPAWPTALRLSRHGRDPFAGYAALLDAVAARAAQFEVVHSHLDWIHLPLLDRIGIPTLTTLHGRMDLSDQREIARRFPNASLVSISNAQRRPLPQLNWIGTVHHGIPADALRFCAEPTGNLVFLGRVAPEKGPDVAVRWARRAGRKLTIAAKIPRVHRAYYEDHVRPYVDGQAICFVGEVADPGKQELLGNAAALLFPIDWPEPFGLVMIEAMACGTPVIARRRGAVAEIVEDGVSGFLVESDAEAVEAISRLHLLDRRSVRDAFDRRFTAERMAEGYLAAYRRLACVCSAARVHSARVELSEAVRPWLQRPRCAARPLTRSIGSPRV